MDAKKVLITVLLLGAAALIVYLIFFRKPKSTDQQKVQQKAPAVEQKPIDSGITIASTAQGFVQSQSNPKGSPYEHYYLTHIDGQTIIEEISKAGYDLFMKEYPSGQAPGNQIEKFKNVMTR